MFDRELAVAQDNLGRTDFLSELDSTINSDDACWDGIVSLDRDPLALVRQLSTELEGTFRFSPDIYELDSYIH